MNGSEVYRYSAHIWCMFYNSGIFKSTKKKKKKRGGKYSASSL